MKMTMNRAVWDQGDNVARLAVICDPCAALLARKCENELRVFHRGPFHGSSDCEMCGQAELALITPA